MLSVPCVPWVVRQPRVKNSRVSSLLPPTHASGIFPKWNRAVRCENALGDDTKKMENHRFNTASTMDVSRGRFFTWSSERMALSTRDALSLPESHPM